MHVEAHLLDRILKLRPSERQVLKGADDGTVKRRIRKRRTIGGGELGLRVDGSGRRVTIKHPSTLKDIVGVLPLMDEEPVRSAYNLETEELMERAEILDGELSTKTIGDPAKEVHGARCQDDVVDVE